MQQQEQCVETTVEIGDGLSVAQKQKKSGNDAILQADCYRCEGW